VTGILNGTVNFLLDRLADGAGFEIALDEARRAGFAEEDPESDLSGADAALKLRIIAAEIWGEEALTLPIETAALTPELCAEIAASGERWVQLATIDAVACNRQAAIRFVRARDVTGLPTLAGERNHLCVVRRDGEMFTASGRGAGGEVTAEAILADLYEIAAIRRNE
jgi:homoserine dehydrogenase